VAEHQLPALAAAVNATPLILVDVDGVLDPEVTARVRKSLVYHDRWTQRNVYVDGRRIRSLLNPEHGGWLRELAAETGAELAWGTTWNDWANIHIGPRIGLPKLPVAPCPWVKEIPGEGYGGKRRDLAVQWTNGRPFVWIDDAPGAASYVKRLAGGQPHHVVKVLDKIGLSRANVAEARDWLLSLRSAEHN
jgi:HAD domain in Swiss Army Knife RNA repair proteins